MGGEALQVLPVPGQIVGKNISKPADALSRVNIG
jgi:hypothetical protein